MKTGNRIEEGKIIAEFMGAKPDEYGRWYYTGATDSTHPYSMGEYPQFFKYHSSWDWLMPVVEKIRTLAKGDNPSNNNLSYKVEIIAYAQTFACKISKSWWERQMLHEERICGRNDTTSLIDVTHNAVVQFILWYNQKK